MDLQYVRFIHYSPQDKKERKIQLQRIKIKNHDERPTNFSDSSNKLKKAQKKHLNVACQNLNTNAVNLTKFSGLFGICTTCFLVCLESIGIILIII